MKISLKIIIITFVLLSSLALLQLGSSYDLPYFSAIQVDYLIYFGFAMLVLYLAQRTLFK